MTVIERTIDGVLWYCVSNADGNGARDLHDTLSTHLDGHIRLESDINLSGYSWTPVGTSANPFLGTFDGGGFVVSNMTISNRSVYGGIFGVSNGASFSNTGVVNANITALSSGVIVGYARSVTINLCYAENCIITGDNCGGIIGEGMDGNSVVNNCYVVNCSISTSTGTVGGLYGWQFGKIHNCYVLNTRVTKSSIWYAGGFAGGTTLSNEIKSCVLYGGNLPNLLVANGTITQSKNYVQSQITNIHSDAWWKTSSNWDGVYPWDFSNTWYWDDTDNLPKLRIFRKCNVYRVKQSGTWQRHPTWHRNGVKWFKVVQ